MNQEKIGKFIAKCRKEKKLTQEQLAENLSVTSKSISRWENGKTMPDVSLFKPLCDELDITINDLLSGEEVEKNMYQKKLEENMFSIISTVNTKISYVRKTIIFIILIISLLLFTLIIIGNHKVILNYNDNKMYVEEKNDTLFFTTKDLCTVYSGDINQYSILDEDNNEIIFLTSKCSYNEIIKKSKYNGNSYRYYPISINGKDSDKIKIYYTDSKISNIKKVSKKQIEEYISKSILIYEK